MVAPTLSKLDTVVWGVFVGCLTRWDTDFGQRTGLMYDQAKLVAEVNGYEFNAPLWRRLHRLELLTLADDEKVRKRKKNKGGAPDAEGVQADEESVN